MQDIAADREADTPSGRSLQVTVQSGRRLHAQIWGKGSTACVLIHGFGEGAYVWKPIAPNLAARIQVIAFDLKGHGDSEWDPHGRYLLKDHVADLEKILNFLNIRRVILVGHSMGGQIAIQYASTNHSRVHALVIVDFGLGMSD